MAVTTHYLIEVKRNSSSGIAGKIGKILHSELNGKIIKFDDFLPLREDIENIIEQQFDLCKAGTIKPYITVCNGLTKSYLLHHGENDNVVITIYAKPLEMYIPQSFEG